MATADVLYQEHDDQYYSSPASRSQQTAGITKFLTAGTIGTALLGLSGLTLTTTVIALIMVTPVLVFFSPVLVPAAIFMFLSASGFVFSCGSGVAAIAALTWLYKYVTNYVAAKQRSQALGASFVQIGL